MIEVTVTCDPPMASATLPQTFVVASTAIFCEAEEPDGSVPDGTEPVETVAALSQPARPRAAIERSAAAVSARMVVPI